MDAYERRAERRRLRREAMTPAQKEEKNRIRRLRRANRRRAEMEDARRVNDAGVAGMVGRAIANAELLNRIRFPTEAPVVAPAPKMAGFLSEEIIGMAERLGIQWDCPVCMDTKAPRDFILSPCGHRICGDCRASMEQSTLRRVCPECRA